MLSFTPAKALVYTWFILGVREASVDGGGLCLTQTMQASTVALDIVGIVVTKRLAFVRAICAWPVDSLCGATVPRRSPSLRGAQTDTTHNNAWLRSELLPAGSAAPQHLRE